MINYNLTEEKLISTFSGKIDSAACTGFESELMKKITEAGKPVVFDLAEVDYIAPSFLRICIHVPKLIGNENFSIINVSPHVKKVFKLVGFDKHLGIN